LIIVAKKTDHQKVNMINFVSSFNFNYKGGCCYAFSGSILPEVVLN